MKTYILTFASISECPTLSIENGMVQYDRDPSSSAAITGGTVATYSCADGYELVGEEKRTCLVDGTWTGTEPQCIGIRMIIIIVYAKHTVILPTQTHRSK